MSSDIPTSWWEVKDAGGWPAGALPPYFIRAKHNGFPPVWSDSDDWALRPHP